MSESLRKGYGIQTQPAFVGEAIKKERKKKKSKKTDK